MRGERHRRQFGSDRRVGFRPVGPAVRAAPTRAVGMAFGHQTDRCRHAALDG